MFVSYEFRLFRSFQILWEAVFCSRLCGQRVRQHETLSVHWRNSSAGDVPQYLHAFVQLWVRQLWSADQTVNQRKWIGVFIKQNRYTYSLLSYETRKLRECFVVLQVFSIRTKWNSVWRWLEFFSRVALSSGSRIVSSMSCNHAKTWLQPISLTTCLIVLSKNRHAASFEVNNYHVHFALHEFN